MGLLDHYSTLPSLKGRTPSSVIVDTDETRLGKAINAVVRTYPGKTGIYALASGRDALAARLFLAMAAEKTLDLQYYIWNADEFGMLLFQLLYEAADRGVRVRLLLDDNNTSGLDDTLAVLDAHPNLEVRLFNPFVIRRPRWINLLTHFSRLNRRMHNKSFTADNQATVIGGRNIGDEYFGPAEGALFIDLDVLAVGPIVNDVSQDFDRYWASASAYPANLILATRSKIPIRLKPFRSAAAQACIDAMQSTPLIQDLSQGTLQFEWAATRMVSDDPAKALDRAVPSGHLTRKLKEAIGRPTSRLEIISPYFVPSEVGTRFLVDLANQGVKVSVLTNSFAATDVAVVHSGYAKYRKRLLEAGVILYELRPQMSTPSPTRHEGTGSTGAASLHAKTFAVDGKNIFIGSFNFDPRSARLNTELGFVIDSKMLASRTDELFATRIPETSYQVHLSSEGHLYWTSAGQRYDIEPDTTFLQRTGIWFFSFLPIESLL
jgi:cardiolipin synthase C